MSTRYDVLVIGAGPAGYHAAIRAAQLGFKTACIDAWENNGEPSPGGTCLNVGCIPSKALLESSELYHRAQHEFEAHGIQAKGVSLKLDAMLARKDKIVSQLTGGIGQLFKANDIDFFSGKAQLQGPGKVSLGEQTIEAEHIILAAGSEPVELKKIAPFDGDTVVDSAGALTFTDVPARLGIIGAGVIGVELGSVWARLGSAVTILEALPDFLPGADLQIAKEAARQFKKQGLDIRLGAAVQQAQVTGKGKKRSVEVSYEQAGKPGSMTFDRLIVAVGRRPASAGLAAESAGLKLNERGFVALDEHWNTNLDKVYAVGDLVGQPMLAHKGMEEGIACVERIAGQAAHVNYAAVPAIIYTAPEIAWVGKSEAQAQADGTEVRTGSFSFAANGRAKAMEQAVGLVKFVADAKTDEILGVHMIGPYVSELIAEMVLAMEYKATAEDIALTMHAHPTLSEVVHEAALDVDDRAIHFAGRKKK